VVAESEAGVSLPPTLLHGICTPFAVAGVVDLADLMNSKHMLAHRLTNKPNNEFAQPFDT
jgi:hypothetical protein